MVNVLRAGEDGLQSMYIMVNTSHAELLYKKCTILFLYSHEFHMWKMINSWLAENIKMFH